MLPLAIFRSRQFSAANLVTLFMYAGLAAKGFADIQPRHGAVLAYLDPEGVRATELSRLSGQHKQVVGTMIDELERLGYVERQPDPEDRRAKLVCPTERGLRQMAAAGQVIELVAVEAPQRRGGQMEDDFGQRDHRDQPRRERR